MTPNDTSSQPRCEPVSNVGRALPAANVNRPAVPALQGMLYWGLALMLACPLTAHVTAQDWPQWRGPDRTGAVEGVKLIDAIPTTGLPILWRSEPIPDTGNPSTQGSDLGYSTPVAADGRVYLYLNQRVKDDSPLRLSWGILNRLGCVDAPLPDELAKKVEAARTSPERAALPSDEVPVWAGEWVARNVPHAHFAMLAGWIEDRLIRGAAAIDLGTLSKLAALKDKPFATREDLDRALREAGLDGLRIFKVVTELTGYRKRALDVLFCFDMETGTTLWKKQYPGVLFEYGTSSTPCVAGGRIYVSGGKTIYCFNAKDGAEIWQAPCPAKEVSSSPIVADGILLIQAGALCALDANDGKLRWTRPEFRGMHASPTIWRNNGKTYAVQYAGLVDLQTGHLLWFIDGGWDSSPVVSGDLLITARDNGLMKCHRLAIDKPTELWKLSRYSLKPSTPVVFKGHLYATKMQSGPLFCVDLASGEIKWTSPEGENYGTSAFNTACLIVADGKILLDGYPNQLSIVRAIPERFELLGKAKLAPISFRGSTPTIASGRLFIRGRDGLVCYDLRGK